MQEQDASRDPLEKQLANLELLFIDFAEQYEAAVRDLREGRIPNRVPGMQLEAARKVMIEIFQTLSDAARPFDIMPIAEDASLTEAADYLDRIFEARSETGRQRQLLEDARIVVAQVEDLEHISNPEVLQRVRDAIATLSDRLDALDFDEAERLTSGQHPLARLAAYTGHRNTLSDEEYDSFRESIEDSFGRPLLRDIDRGWVSMAVESEPVEAAILEEDSEAFSIEEGEYTVETNEFDMTPGRFEDDSTENPEMNEFNGNDFEAALVHDFDTDEALDLDLADGEEPEEVKTSSYEITEYTDSNSTYESEEASIVYENSDSIDAEEDDTSWPSIEGDGFGAVDNDLPSAAWHETTEKEDED